MAAQVDQVLVRDPGARQREAQLVLREVRMASRRWVAPHVDHKLDAVLSQERDELVQRPVRVPDRPHDERADPRGAFSAHGE
jgi:hypothetical protein